MNNEAKYELQIFASNQFGQIRTLMLEDVPWFANSARTVRPF